MTPQQAMGNLRQVTENKEMVAKNHRIVEQSFSVLAQIIKEHDEFEEQLAKLKPKEKEKKDKK